MNTHGAFIEAVATAAVEFAAAHSALTDEERAGLAAIKLVYGAGHRGLHGVTYFNRWKPADSQEPHPFVEVCAFGQLSALQLAETTLHELGHVLAGPAAGHAKAWRLACARLGLVHARVKGATGTIEIFAEPLRLALQQIPPPDEGEPVTNIPPGLLGPPLGPRGGKRGGGGRVCPTGGGTKGGTTRGPGSGSRLRLFHCACEPPIKARVASDTFDANCNVCGEGFRLAAPKEEGEGNG